jgi:ribonuclease BN (tRNA processing enzyme)
LANQIKVIGNEHQMRLNCLGTVGYHPNSQRHTSCYFLAESGILLDAGTGIFRLPGLIQRDNLDILLSHAHLDHSFGLTVLLNILFERPVERVRVWGEREKLQAIREHLFHDLLFPVPITVQWCEIDELDQFEIEGARITWMPQEHPGGSVAYRIEWPKKGKSLVYATDTVGDTSRRSNQWKAEPDLLMHECYFRDSLEKFAIKTGHCWTSRLIEVVQKCRPKRLLVTHVNPLELASDPVDLERIRDAVDCEVVLAEDDLSLDF